MRLPFWKVQAVGNDFVLIHADDVPVARSLAEIAQIVCARRTSIGADGLLVLGAEEGRLVLRMFNPDGTEDFCGNGLRCAAVHAVLHGWVSTSTFSIEHGEQSVPIEVSGSGPHRLRVRTRLEPASFDPSRVPVTSSNAEVIDRPWTIAGHEVRVSALTTGSTHAVILVESKPEDALFSTVSAALEHDPAFPERTSVVWAWPGGADEIGIRIWERGVGETLGCGTGSAAAAIVWARQTGVGGPLRIQNPGGGVAIVLEDWESPILVESDAEEVYAGWTELV